MFLFCEKLGLVALLAAARYLLTNRCVQYMQKCSIPKSVEGVIKVYLQKFSATRSFTLCAIFRQLKIIQFNYLLYGIPGLKIGVIFFLCGVCSINRICFRGSILKQARIFCEVGFHFSLLRYIAFLPNKGYITLLHSGMRGAF